MSSSSVLRSLKKRLELLLDTVREDSNKELDECGLSSDGSFSAKDETGRSNLLIAYQALGIFVGILSYAASAVDIRASTE